MQDASGAVELVAVGDDARVVARTKHVELKAIAQGRAATAVSVPGGVVFAGRVVLGPEQVYVVVASEDGTALRCGTADCSLSSATSTAIVGSTYHDGAWISAAPLDDGAAVLAGTERGILLMRIAKDGAASVGELPVPLTTSYDGFVYAQRAELAPSAAGRPLLFGRYSDRGADNLTYAVPLAPDGSLAGEIERRTTRLQPAACRDGRCIALQTEGDAFHRVLVARGLDASGATVSTTTLETAPPAEVSECSGCAGSA